jgi:hypothetical protein
MYFHITVVISMIEQSQECKMPLTLLVTEGAIPRNREQETVARLSETFLELHGLVGNKFMIPNVIGHIEVLPEDRSFSGLRPVPVAMIEWKVPSFTFTDREVQINYIRQATDIAHEASEGKLPKDRIWVNVTHAVDGAWGIAGKAMTNAELGEMVARAAAPLP